jgi:hypothetical protein
VCFVSSPDNCITVTFTNLDLVDCAQFNQICHPSGRLRLPIPPTTHCTQMRIGIECELSVKGNSNQS